MLPVMMTSERSAGATDPLTRTTQIALVVNAVPPQRRDLPYLALKKYGGAHQYGQSNRWSTCVKPASRRSRIQIAVGCS